jgi:hypothetical protein
MEAFKGRRDLEDIARPEGSNPILPPYIIELAGILADFWIQPPDETLPRPIPRDA